MRRSGLLLALVALLAAAVPCRAQGATPVANAASSPASAPAEGSVSEIVVQLASSEAELRTALDRLPPEHKWKELEQRIGDAEAAYTRDLVPTGRGAETASLIGLSHDAWYLGNEVAAIVRELTTLVRHLEHERIGLELDAQRWRDSLPILVEAEVPAPVIEGAQSMERQVLSTAARVRDARDQGLLALVRAQSLQAKIVAATARLATDMERTMEQRTALEAVPIWRLGASEVSPPRTATKLGASVRLLRDYLMREGAQLALMVGIIFGLCWWLFARPAGPAAIPARRAYGSPVAASLLIAMVMLWWLAPAPPLLFYDLLLMLLPLPMLVLARRAFGTPVLFTLFGISLATILMGLRGTFFDWSALDVRLLLLVQMACLGIALTLDLRSGRLHAAFSRWSAQSVRALALILIVATLFSALHAIFGLAGPSRTLRVGVAGLLGFGLIFGTAAMVLYGALLASLETPLLGWLLSARSADPTLLRALRVVSFVLAAVCTVVATLGAMTLVPVVLSMLQSVSQSTIDVGAVSLSTTALATFVSVVFGTYLLSGLIRFVLDREMFPRMQMRPGVGYAITTFTRWFVFIAGGVLALAALGVDSTRITVLAGALGVGIGFGLQTVVNNFVSGLILIVERPVAVGDLVEIGPLFGEIQRIGIRSSSVRTTQGAEVIVPNSDFASKEVINWTRSDRQRRYDIDVGVAYGSDPTQVMQLLVEAAGDVPEVMAQPAPLAMFKGFGDSSLDFRLLAWVSTIDLGVKAQSALRIAVLRKLEAAGIAIPFPQRDVYLHAVGDAAPPKPDA